MVVRSSSRSPTASGNPPNPGPTCCAIAAAAACGVPVLAVGDGALGFWAALREVFPDTRDQRCWWHKQANVLAGLPKSARPGALAAMREIYNAEDVDRAQVAIKGFEIDYGAKYPKAVAKIVDDADVLLEFYRYPAEHWVHLRTTNPSRSLPPCGCGPRSPKVPAHGRPELPWPTS